MAARRATDILFLGALFTVTFTKLQWDSAGGMVLADLLTAFLLAALTIELLVRGDVRIPRAAVEILVIGGCLLAVYSTGFVSAAQPHQVVKGLVRVGLHFALLAGGVTYLAWRSREYLWGALGCLCAGITASALYAAAQLAAHETGRNLDAALISPVTGRPARTLIYGLNQSPDVPRVTGLTTDPDHLAVMLIVPILLLLPLYVVERRGRRRLPIGFLLAALLLAGAATFSRSGLVGLAAGAAVVALRYRRRLWSRRVLLPVGAVVLLLVALAALDPTGSTRIVTARLRIDRTAMTHVHQYDFISRAFHTNAAFGIGLENFGRRYAPITHNKDFGPHSFYVQSLTETGLLGTLAFGVFLAYVVRRLRAAARVAATAKENALVVGLTATLVGTMAANIFYLTMTFYYFYAFLIVGLALAMKRESAGALPRTDTGS